MIINLQLEDLTENNVKYSFKINEITVYIAVNFDNLKKNIQYINESAQIKELNIDNINDTIIETIYQKILWYQKLDNFFANGIVVINDT